MREVPFAELMRRLAERDEGAARVVFDRYARRLVGLAAVHLPGALRGKADPESVVQSALASFFARQAAGGYDLGAWDDLWKLLAVMTVHKCGHRVAHFAAAKRAVGREVPAADPDDLEAARGVADVVPSPQEALLLRETVEQLFAALKPRDHEVVRLRLEGHTVGEIADLTGRSERTVHRTLETARDHLARITEGTPPA
jgi:RNA polymerase sigma-70 factor (ECF subfamily)